MFLSLDSPLVGRKTLHKRSKTITILVNQQKRYNVPTSSKKSLSLNKISKTSQVINKKTPKACNDDKNMQLISVKKMTERIQKLISRQLEGSQHFTYINRGSSRLSAKQRLKNPQISESFQETFYEQKFSSSTHNHNSCGFRQPEYLTMLRKSQVLNSKSFIPHFNWKQKLSRLKNMGNYGLIYKNHNSKDSNRKFTAISIPEKQNSSHQEAANNQAINSLKISSEPYSLSANRQHLATMPPQKKLSCKRCKTDNYSLTQKVQKSRNTNTYTYKYGDNFYSRKFSQTKDREGLFKKSHSKSKQHDRQWKFQPWQAEKQNNQ